MKTNCHGDRKLIIHNVDIVTPTGIIEDSGLLIEDSIIATIGNISANEPGEHIDGGHQLLMPGFIDLHSDALEKYIEPRAGSMFPLPTAILEFDKTLAACGITTMYHCICFSYDDSIGRELRSNKMAVTIIHELLKLKNWLRVKTKQHIRFDVLNKEAADDIISLMENRQVDLLSFMDHTPGQGQYSDPEVLREKVSKEWKFSDKEIDLLLEERIDNQKRIDWKGLDRIADIAARHDVTMASHDDDSREKVSWAEKMRFGISEFPVCGEAIEAAKEKGLLTVFGAPNVLRGKSQSGNLSATEEVLAGNANILASDYSPMSLLHAIFKLNRQDDVPLHEAVGLISLNPAKAVGIDKQTGSVEIGKDADLVLVNAYSRVPHVTMTITGGEFTYRTNCPGGIEKAV